MYKIWRSKICWCASYHLNRNIILFFFFFVSVNSQLSSSLFAQFFLKYENMQLVLQCCLVSPQFYLHLCFKKRIPKKREMNHPEFRNSCDHSLPTVISSLLFIPRCPWWIQSINHLINSVRRFSEMNDLFSLSDCMSYASPYLMTVILNSLLISFVLRIFAL